jgi:hypothetical protein
MSPAEASTRKAKEVASTARKTFRYDKDGVHLLGSVNVAAATSEGGPDARQTRVSSRQRVRVVQRDGQTVVSEEIETSEGEGSRTDRPDGPGKEEKKMTETPQEYRSLSREELEAIAGEELPERAAMSLINANIAAPVNVAAALNVLSDNSTAIANAEQTADITQSTGPMTQQP